MKRVILGAALLLCVGCADRPKQQQSLGLKSTDTIHVPYGVSIYTYKGNEYLLVKSTSNGTVSICPALPPKAEKEPGHAE